MVGLRKSGNEPPGSLNYLVLINTVAEDERRLATGWTARVCPECRRGGDFSSLLPSCPDWYWGPHSLL